MKKLITLCFSIIVSFYAGQALAADKPCPYNKGLHAKVAAKKQVLTALNHTSGPLKRYNNGNSKAKKAI